jgi:hypothetical protein
VRGEAKSKEWGMRAIVVSGGILAVAAIFGVGVVVGRFVLDRDAPSVSSQTNAIIGFPDTDNALASPDNAVIGDTSLNAPPPTIAAPLPPLTQPGIAIVPPKPPVVSPRAESEAAIAASSVTVACDIKVSKNAPIRSWGAKDRVTVTALGQSCGASTIRIMLETPEGTALYSLQAPARDFGITTSATPDDVRDRLLRLIPTDAVRAAAYPAWPADGAAPTRSEFTRDNYEAVRAANNPVTCLKLPTGSQRCVAADPSNGQIKVFSRG